ncbi:MAG: bi-domain-containing oxidoreductase [Candidatus Vecturithrix sp.]|jgi:predicted dehydrogenase/NADPH:quinone reductase-like Zn-dependent oxidoreductase|nr:bi-domain-containing oxidoreductase [Candidatus Vecturithrix sp.]
MKQILQNLKTGATELVDLPAPGVSRGQVMVSTRRTLVSVGTERMLIDFGKAGWIEKARQQPEKVRQVIDKIRTDGLVPTIEAVFNKLDEPMPLGYCNAGVVLEVGAGVADFKPGDRVISNGPHAEVVCVPRNLCAKIPNTVSDEEASFTVLASIALQGVRLSQPTLGERFMVFGLGLVGLLTVQFLRASGCPILAVDVSQARLKLAESFGAETVDLSKGTDPVAAALAWTGGQGVDGVIIAASAKGDDIVHQAAESCRKRGRIILVGVVDLNLRRNDFYTKEITFQVSCSYGPGRYDEKYEQAGQDYPLGFVRWTEQRNFEAVLEAMRSGQLRVKDLITHRIALEDAAEAYDKVLHDPAALGTVIEYPGIDNAVIRSHAQLDIRDSYSEKNKNGIGRRGGDSVKVGVIGAGNYAKATLLPALSRTTARLVAVADINGMAAAHAARKFGAEKAVSDYRLVLDNPDIQAVFVLVGHHLHSRFIIEVLAAGKHVFVEKPLAINENQLQEILSIYPSPLTSHSSRIHLMVGFNRRFSPHTVKIRELLAGRSEPLTMTMTVNAGFIPVEHWTQDPERGGGRIIGEGCHFIDLLSFLTNSPVTSVSAMMVGGSNPVRDDKMSIMLGFADGSVGTVNYFANGSKNFPKETLEIFGEGRVIRMENFRVTSGYGFKGFRSFQTWRQDKGHRAEIAAFIKAVGENAPPLIPFDEIVNATRASFAAVESARKDMLIRTDGA